MTVNPYKIEINTSKIIQETIDGEVVIVNMETGTYYSLTEQAAEIWALIEAGANFQEITGQFSQRYQGDPQAIQLAIEQWVVQLQQEGIVLLESSPNSVNKKNHNGHKPASLLVTDNRPAFKTPRLQKFDDMQELLLLDPIHEVDETGWPHTRPDAGEGNA